jgi:hypothetical protein
MNHLDAFYQTVHSAPGGAEAIANRMGMSAQVLRNKANVNSDTNKPTLDDADRLMGITGDYRVLESLAANHGFTLTKVEEHAPSEMSVFESMTGILAQFGQYSQEVHQAFADGRLEPHELTAIDESMFALFQRFMQFRARMGGMVEKRGAR